MIMRQGRALLLIELYIIYVHTKKEINKKEKKKLLY